MDGDLRLRNRSLGPQALTAVVSGKARGWALGVPLPALALLAVAVAPAAPRAREPTLTVAPAAIRVLVPGRAAAASAAPPTTGGTATQPTYSYPANGAVVVGGASTVSTATVPYKSTSGSAKVVNVSLFDGEITADSVSDAASARLGLVGPAGRAGHAQIVNLQALGSHVSKGQVLLGDWGTLTVGDQTLVRGTQGGVKRYALSVAGLEVVLSRPHAGLPAGSEIEVAAVDVSAATAPPAPPPPPPVRYDPVPGDRPQLLPPTTGPLVGVPQVITPPLAGGLYVFPVVGHSTYLDDFGTVVPGASYEHGVDVFGQLGQPLVAVAAGTLYAVGWSPLGGNRLWLRDRGGDEFFYAHLSAFAPLVANGAHVQAGEVIGFMGDTGETDGLSTHLEFEIRPVSLVYLGSEGVVDPTSYFASWRPETSVQLPAGPGWAPTVPGSLPAPVPAATLVASSDIAAAEALDPGALRRILAHDARR